VTHVEDELRRCFQVAFPDLAPGRIAAASVETVAEWDSLHALILIALIEEAFAVRIPSGDYPELRSYAAIARYLGGVTRAGS
jgi:acyl carrier protein